MKDRGQTINKRKKERRGKEMETEERRGKSDSGLQEEACRRGNIGQHLH